MEDYCVPRPFCPVNPEDRRNFLEFLSKDFNGDLDMSQRMSNGGSEHIIKPHMFPQAPNKNIEVQSANINPVNSIDIDCDRFCTNDQYGYYTLSPDSEKSTVNVNLSPSQDEINYLQSRNNMNLVNSDYTAQYVNSDTSYVVDGMNQEWCPSNMYQQVSAPPVNSQALYPSHINQNGSSRMLNMKNTNGPNSSCTFDVMANASNSSLHDMGQNFHMPQDQRSMLSMFQIPDDISSREAPKHTNDTLLMKPCTSHMVNTKNYVPSAQTGSIGSHNFSNSYTDFGSMSVESNKSTTILPDHTKPVKSDLIQMEGNDGRLANSNCTSKSTNVLQKQKQADSQRKIGKDIKGGRSRNKSSNYKGVTKHRRSGRYEAHLWIRELHRQVYLGGYEQEEHAAEAYDVAALKSKGMDVKTNFDISRYSVLTECMGKISMEELIMAVRRQSQGFSRGSSSYRGVTHHSSGRWEARIGVPGSKHIYLGLHDGEDEAAKAYDRALVRLRGVAAATNFLLSEYKTELAYNQYVQQELKKLNLTDDVLTGEVFEEWIRMGNINSLQSMLANLSYNMAKSKIRLDLSDEVICKKYSVEDFKLMNKSQDSQSQTSLAVTDSTYPMKTDNVHYLENTPIEELIFDPIH